jgi:glyoxylase-like metal-dependent hydrolase (beta-lactamase superfamily II)/8-oxo-dGTP pyrophosphatase MutT (NUDIX family)
MEASAIQAPHPAATIVLLRPGPQGPEVLMLQRTQSAAFLGGAYVFPGGSLDAADADPAVLARVTGRTEDEADAKMKVKGGPALPYYVAAVRECFEEAGVLLATTSQGAHLAPDRAAALMRFRDAPFNAFLAAEDLYVPAGELAYFGHWITAPGRSRRFNTRFFVALAPQGQEGAHDQNETVHSMWVRPQDALDRAEKGEIELVTATQTTLRELARFQDAREAFEHAASVTDVEENRACWAQGSQGTKLFRRTDPQYFEIHWADPEETGTSSYEIVPGVPKRLDRLVTRLTAPNPGAMTGPGTNTYLVGDAELTVVDPGPDLDSHVRAILEAGAGRIRRVLCTHTHLDHSPAAAAIKAATGAQVLGRTAPAGQDATFRPDVVLEHGQRIAGFRAIHTPGHASNHLCYLLEETRMLFTGDHVMQGSTVVINPPDGDMRAYLASLELLLAEDLAIIAPGHGFLIGMPHRELRRLIAHRLSREAKVRRALAQHGPASLEALVPFVYDDVSARMHRWAARSLSAHLGKLLAEGAVAEGPDGFALVESPRVAP